MPFRQFPVIELSGTSREIGRAYGSACRAQIERAMGTFEAKLLDLGVALDVAIAHAMRSLPYCREVAPDLVQEVEGIASGSGLSFEQIFALNASLDLYGASQRFRETPPPECWALAVTGAATANGRTLMLWTAEDDARWLEACVLLRILPEGGLPCLVWTIAGSVGRPGLNPLLAMSAVCRTTSDVGEGLPYPFVCRRILAAESVAVAVEAIGSVQRMSGMGYVLGDAVGVIAVVETSAGAHRVVEGRGGWVACTGLVNDGGLPRLDALSDYQAGSVPDLRLRRIAQLLREHWGQNTLADLQRLQCDHGPGDLCAHAGGGWGVPCLSTFIADLPARTLWVAYGNPCQDGYTPVDMATDRPQAAGTTHALRLADGRFVWIRRVRASDAPLFETYFAGLSEQSRDYMHGWSGSRACTLEHAQALAAKAASGDHVAVAVLAPGPGGERMVGYCWIDGLAGDDVPMLGIGIADDYHEVGLGKLMLRLMLAEAGRRGFEQVRLGVWEDNSRARHVYQTVGFRLDPDRPAKVYDGRVELYMIAPAR